MVLDPAISSDTPYGATTQGINMLLEVWRPSQRPCITLLPREVGSQLIESKELSWGIIRELA
jgi:hypothetical protein